jgi:hypothetical protein
MTPALLTAMLNVSSRKRPAESGPAHAETVLTDAVTA